MAPHWPARGIGRGWRQLIGFRQLTGRKCLWVNKVKKRRLTKKPFDTVVLGSRPLTIAWSEKEAARRSVAGDVG